MLTRRHITTIAAAPIPFLLGLPGETGSAISTPPRTGTTTTPPRDPVEEVARDVPEPKGEEVDLNDLEAEEDASDED